MEQDQDNIINFEDYKEDEVVTKQFDGFIVKESVRKDDDGNMLIEGYASTFGNEDSHGDIIERGAFVTRFIKERKPKFLAQHRSDMVIGVWDSFRQDEKGLYVKGRFVDTDLGKEYYALAKAGAIDSFSIGFNIPKGGQEWDDKKKVRRIKQINLWEVSLVTFPANSRALVSGVKDLDTVRKFERELCGTLGFSRSEATVIINEGYKSLLDKRDAVKDGEEGAVNDAARAELMEAITNLTNKYKG